MSKRTCSIDGCDRPHRALGWCQLHYQRWRNAGETGPPGGGWTIRLCSIEGCDRQHVARGWCGAHYSRWRTYGDPTHQLPKKSCLVEGCSDSHYSRGMCRLHYCRVRATGTTELREPRLCSAFGCGEKHYGRGWCKTHYKRWKWRGGDPASLLVAPRGSGYTAKDGYRRIYVNGQPIAEHRAVMEDLLGRPLRLEESVHHINGVRDDNRFENLELWSSSHPSGQRVADKVAWAREIIALYGGSA